MEELDALFAEMDSLCPGGYNIGFHFRFSRPVAVRSTYHEDWSRHYAISKFILGDPAVIWGLTNIGACRWSAIELPDPLGVFTDAARFGLAYGVALSVGAEASRSLGACGRGDREYTDEEIEVIHDRVRRIHEVIARQPGLKSHQQEVLQLLEAGLTYDQICAELDLSRTALVNRLKGARRAFGVATNAEAIRIGLDRGYLTSTSLTGVTKGLPFS